MKPFDLEAAKAGAKVVTRDGRRASFVGVDMEESQPIGALVGPKGHENFSWHNINGVFYVSGKESNRDLMMATDEHGGYVYE